MSHRMHWIMPVVLSAVIGLTVSDVPAENRHAVAEEGVPQAERKSTTSEQLAGWIRDLESDDFETRNRATRRLEAAGQEAIPPVAAAALAGGLELAVRCVGILETLFRSEDAAVREAAEAALEKLADGENKSVAQRAAAVVRPQPPEPPGNVIGGPIRIRIQQQVQRPQAREVEVEEDGKKIRLRRTPQGEITIRVVEEADGKKTTTEYTAKDLDELKRKHPEAAKLYEKHMPAEQPQVQRRQVIAGGGRIVIGGQAVPGRQVQVRVTNGNREIDVVEQDGRRIRITDEDGRNIVVRVEETDAQGNRQTTEAKGKDLDELKENHPEAAKLYEQYTTQDAPFRILGRADDEGER